MKVTFFYRPKSDAAHSIEAVFEIIKTALPKEVQIENFVCTTKWKRWQSFIAARKFQGDINHITGDIHTMALFLNPKKTIITVHDIGRYERDLKGIKKILVKYLWLIWPLKRVAAVTVISDFTRQKLIEICKVPADKIKLIPNPSNIDFEYSPYLFNNIKPVILQIGGGNNKNIYRLIEAIKGLQFKLLLIRPIDESLKKILEQNSIEYEWKSNLSRQEVYESYKRCDIVFFASEYEGFGVPIIEANSIGRPVITSNLSSMPYVAGNAGKLVNPYNVKEIRDALLEIKENKDLREQLINNGIENVKRFSNENIGKLYYQTYLDVLNKFK